MGMVPSPPVARQRLFALLEAVRGSAEDCGNDEGED